MTNIIACIDGSAIAPAVCDAAAWANTQLSAPLTLLHVLDKSEYPSEGNLSGNIGLGSREHLLEQLTQLDEQRARLALEHGKELLEKAEQRVVALGATSVSKQQRHGSLLETLLELEAETRLFVMGRLGESHEAGAATLGSHLENVVRAVHRPILVCVQNFIPPTRFLFAYDGSPTADKILETLIGSPLLKNVPGFLVMVGSATAERQSQLARAAERLSGAGFNVVSELIEGDVQQVLQDFQVANNIDLMVMGAYGHSRIRQFFVGSNTTRMISKSKVPLLLLR